MSAREAREAAADPLEDALAQLGPFGFYQKYVLLLICIPNMLGAMHTLNYVFVVGQVPFRCLVPECEGGDAGVEFNNSWVDAFLSAESRCHRRAPPAGSASCDPRGFNRTHDVVCEQFVYLNADTAYSEFNLACREWMRTLVGTVRNCALPIALILTGYVSDGYGRRTALCVFAMCAGALGVAKSFSVNYQMYIAMEFLEAALGYGFNSAGYVMAIELARPSLRAAFACGTGVAYGVGGMLFAWAAWAVPRWRELLRWLYAPALLLGLYRLALDESPRWLHAAGRADRAVRVLRKAARWNKALLREDTVAALEKAPPEPRARAAGPWRRLLGSRVLVLRFALCSLCWAATTFVYYGLTINSVTLSGDRYVNFALNMGMEVVASLLIAMALERFGRRRCIFVSFLLCGIACVVPYFTDHSGTGLGLFFVGKLAITFAFNGMYVFTAELFPTPTRSSALAACSLVGRLGSVLAPQTPLLGPRAQALAFGAAAGAAAGLALLAPETRRAALPASVAAAERVTA